MKSPAIEAKNIKRLFDAKQVLKNISFDVNMGEVVMLKGKNGAGKTTLLRILTTLLKPTDGEAWLNGHSIIKSPEKAKSQMGWISSTQNGFVSRLNGRQNLHLFGSVYKLSKKEINKRLEIWNHLDPFKQALDTPFYLCSAGMKQTLGLFRGILHDPSILFLDEPGLHLDADATKILQAFFANNQKQTILFSAHEQSLLSNLATRVVELRNGELLEAK